MSEVEMKNYGQPLVAIVMGSQSDAKSMKPCRDILMSLEIPLIARVISAHRTPEQTGAFAKNASGSGIEIIIAGAGASAALPGTVAAHTHLPVIGVPLNATSLGGLDALFAIAQMPSGIPVATMAIGEAGAKNAGLYAARILALTHPDIKTRLLAHNDRVFLDAKEKTSLDPFSE
ncbi:MAG TPA: 5-(carboxyamino)imidazole ribonucleotide mutase [Myxococcota bacterium]|nr:5-(carboxyamino)imidazole ribonucleotide mutase [Myxococcota bacterium]